MKKKKKNNIIIDIIKDKHMRAMLVPLVFASTFLIFGTYAWFTYFSDVNGTMTGHVIGWNIDFSGETEIEDEYNITVDKIYPGMKDYKSELVITNSGEASAFIDFKIMEVKILDKIYKVGEFIDDTEITSEYLLEMVTSKYPFKFNFEITNNLVKSGENVSFKADLVWDYETFIKVSDEDEFNQYSEYYLLVDGKYQEKIVTKDTYPQLKKDLYMVNDIEDTYWGEEATKFITNNPDEVCIDLKIEIHATQYLEEE